MSDHGEHHGHGGGHEAAAEHHAAPTEHAPAHHEATTHEAAPAAEHHAAPAHHETAANHAPAAAHHAAAAHAAPTGPGGNSPFARGLNRARGLEQNVVQASNRVKGTVGKFLRFEQKTATETGWAKTPFYALGHAIDGTVLNLARRGYEVAEPLISGMRAVYRSTIGAVLSPIQTLTSPLQYLKNPLRIATSVATAALNVVRAPIRALDDLVERGIKNTIQQVTFKLAKIPAIKTILAKPADFITSTTTRIGNAVRNAMDWVTSPVDTVHNALAPA